MGTAPARSHFAFQRGRPASGFGLIDTLVASLLLSLSLLAVGTALIQSLHGAHAALLQSRAMDLAADLSEARQSARSAEEFAVASRQWRDRMSEVLPLDGMVASDVATLHDLDSNGVPAAFEIRMQWQQTGQARPATLVLPVAAPSFPATP